MLFEMLELVMKERSKLLFDIPELVNGEIYVHCLKNI
jgi:hypothetical protein